MIKFFLDAMYYYQIFIYNRDRFRMENPHDRTIMLICGILFLPIISIGFLFIKENFDYKPSFVIFIFLYVVMYRLLHKYIKNRKGAEIIKRKPLLLNNQRFSSFISWMIYPFLVVLLYFIITHRHWLKII